RHGPLVEQRRFHGSPPPCQALRQSPGREAALQGLDAHPVREVRLELAGLEQEPRAEAPNVAVGDVRSVVSSDNSASVTIVVQRATCGVAKTPRHPVANPESATGVEPNNQTLPA